MSHSEPIDAFDVPAEDEFFDLLAASTSSTDFWDNDEDDKDWNQELQKRMD